MSKKFTPLYDHILVERTDDRQTTEQGHVIQNGILIPANNKEKLAEGRVLSVGAGRINDDGQILPLTVKPGDAILFGKYAGTEITLNHKPVLVMREEEVLGVLTEE